MKKKSEKTFRGPTLQEFEMVPITDPDQIAALERRIREAEKSLAARRLPVRKTKPRKKK
jgi:hypothetical protein